MSEGKKYEQLLDDVYSKLPEKTTSSERFEMPHFEYFTEGNKTIVKNFKAVVDKIRREPAMLIKFLTKELAVPAEAQGERLVLARKLTGDIVNKKLEDFVNKYVICKECKRPDTHIDDKAGFKQLICESCGARAPIR
jgi:translation initiation factor 2 subunit 2